jgi:hypothetical protein
MYTYFPDVFFATLHTSLVIIIIVVVVVVVAVVIVFHGLGLLASSGFRTYFSKT